MGKTFISVGRFKTFSFIGSVDIWGSFPIDVQIIRRNRVNKQLISQLQVRSYIQLFPKKEFICLDFMWFLLLQWSLNIPKNKEEKKKKQSTWRFSKQKKKDHLPMQNFWYRLTKFPLGRRKKKE